MRLSVEEAVEAIIHFHAGVVILMERASRHAALVDRQPIPFGCLPRCHSLFYSFKKIQIIAPPLLLHFVRFCVRIYEHLF